MVSMPTTAFAVGLVLLVAASCSNEVGEAGRTNVSISAAVAPLKIAGCLMNPANRCIEPRTIAYSFPKADFTGLAHGMTRQPPSASQNRVCSVVVDARGRTLVEAGQPAKRCKLNPPLPAAKVVHLFTQPVAGPGCSSYWYLENQNGEPLKVTLKEEFWNGAQPGCGSPQEGNPQQVGARQLDAPARQRVGIKCAVTPADSSHMCSWHIRLSCTKGSNGFCQAD